MNVQGRLFIISAPSGAGKTSLVTNVLAKLDDHPIDRVVTYTTKRPRAGEIEGSDYHFITEELFKERIAENYFLEWSTAYGAYYGSPRYLIDQMVQGRSQVLIIDRVGTQQLVKSIANIVLIWIAPPSLQELKARLAKRATESEADFAHRIDLARQEMEQEVRAPLYHYQVLNDDFVAAAKQLEAIMRQELAHMDHR